jgi:hypothetical protein
MQKLFMTLSFKMPYGNYRIKNTKGPKFTDPTLEAITLLNLKNAQEQAIHG